MYSAKLRRKDKASFAPSCYFKAAQPSISDLLKKIADDVSFHAVDCCFRLKITIKIVGRYSQDIARNFMQELQHPQDF